MAATSDDKPAVASLSDTERELDSAALDKFAGFEDPDAGLSEEEKAKIVRMHNTNNQANHPCNSCIWALLSSFCQSLRLLTASRCFF
jgi:hypothetical protein